MEVLDRFEDPLRPDWLVFLLLALLVLLALVRIFGRERLMVMASSMTRPRMPRQEVREKSDVLDIGYIGLWMITALSVGLFVYQELLIRGYHSLPFGPFRSYMAICLAIGAYFIAKFLFLKISMFLFGEDVGGTEYFYNTFMLFSIAGVALIPLSIFRSYVQWFPDVMMWLGVAILALTIIYQWARGWIIAVGNGSKPIYIFLYFCMLEILPLAVMVRFIYDATAA